MFSTLCLYTRDQKNTKNEMIWTRSERKYQNTWVKKNLNSPFPKITDLACWLNHRPFNFRAKMLRSLPVRLWTSRGKENKPLFTVCYLFIALRSNIFILLLWNFDSENLNICDVFLYIAQGARGHTRDVAWSRKRTRMSSAPAIISQTLQFWCKWRNLKYVLCFLYAMIHWSIRNLNPSFKDLLTAVGNPMNDFSDLIIKQIKSA